MNWLTFGFGVFGVYVVWFTYLLVKRKYTKALLWYGIVHLPYLLVNAVAPFRGFLDPEYVGYSFGLIVLPQGPLVLLVVGAMVAACIVIITKSMLNQMDGYWKFALVTDGLLAVFVALPTMIGIVSDPSEGTIKLGEFLTISGYVVALIIFILFTGPTLFSHILFWEEGA